MLSTGVQRPHENTTEFIIPTVISTDSLGSPGKVFLLSVPFFLYRLLPVGVHQTGREDAGAQKLREMLCALAGHTNAEYCNSHPFGEKGHVCRDMGTVPCERNEKTEMLYLNYRRVREALHPHESRKADHGRLRCLSAEVIIKKLNGTG